MQSPRSMAGNLVKPALRRFGYTIAFDDDYEPEAQRVMSAAAPYTLTTRPRLYALWQAVRYVVQADLPGDIVECGVWRGGSMFAVAETLIQLNSTSRSLYLCDTFSGMTVASDSDVDALGGRVNRVKEADAPLDAVRGLMAQTGYPTNQLRYVVGDVVETLPAQAPDEISLLRLDTDWYESTKHELEALYDRLVVGGVLIIDDYGYWQGARKAVDEFFAGRSEPVLLNRVDSSCRVVVKHR